MSTDALPITEVPLDSVVRLVVSIPGRRGLPQVAAGRPIRLRAVEPYLSSVIAHFDVQTRRGVIVRSITLSPLTPVACMEEVVPA